MLSIICLTCAAILIVLIIYSKKKTHWDIQACPFEVLGEDETGDSIRVLDQGVERSLELMFTFDFDANPEKRCYVVREPEEEIKQECYVFWRENPDGEFVCTCDERLRRVVQKIFVGSIKFAK